jgi:hypothetical protein
MYVNVCRERLDFKKWKQVVAFESVRIGKHEPLGVHYHLLYVNYLSKV